jgi:hypothetical protein
MKQEVELFRHGTTVLPFLDHLNHVSTVMKVRNLRAGILSTDMREIIETREADIGANVRKNDAFYIKQVEELRAQYPGKIRRFRTYEDVLTQFTPDLHRFVEADVNRQQRLVSADEALRIAKRVDEFPTIRSVVRAGMYLRFHCLVSGTGARRSNMGDYRNVVEAAYCTALATADRQLAKIAPRINPELRVLTFENILDNLRPRSDSN